MNFLDIPEHLKDLLKDPNTIPSEEKVLRAFSYFPPKATKVIILGMDPYPNKENACGLAFSVEHTKIPASLKNIYKELSSDIGCAIPRTGNLEPWSRQGVLLLNTVLTTKKNKSGAHIGKGWEEYTKQKVQKILNYKTPVVIIAWGKNAHDFVDQLQTHDKSLILKGKHPSPLNRSGGFLGGKYFSKANEFLIANGIEKVDWRL